MNNAVFGATMENVKKIDILNLSQHKKERLFSIRAILSYCNVFHRKLIGNRKEINNDNYV